MENRLRMRREREPSKTFDGQGRVRTDSHKLVYRIFENRIVCGALALWRFGALALSRDATLLVALSGGGGLYAQSVSEQSGINAPIGVSPSAADFVRMVALSDMFEIESAKLAPDRSTDAKVRAGSVGRWWGAASWSHPAGRTICPLSVPPLLDCLPASLMWRIPISNDLHPRPLDAHCIPLCVDSRACWGPEIGLGMCRVMDASRGLSASSRSRGRAGRCRGMLSARGGH